MDRGVRAGVMALLLGLPCAWAPAADIGGWFADQQKAAAQAAAPDPDACPQVLRRAAATAGAGAASEAANAYHAALCYLQAEPADRVAAQAWLVRAAELRYLPAQRMLRAIRAADAGPHRATPHCHALGNGQQICHGGAPVAGAAAPADE